MHCVAARCSLTTTRARDRPHCRNFPKTFSKEVPTSDDLKDFQKKFSYPNFYTMFRKCAPFHRIRNLPMNFENVATGFLGQGAYEQSGFIAKVGYTSVHHSIEFLHTTKQSTVLL